MGSGLGLLRFFAAILMFSVFVPPPVDLPGSMGFGSGAAWARFGHDGPGRGHDNDAGRGHDNGHDNGHDDDHDHDDDDDDDGDSGSGFDDYRDFGGRSDDDDDDDDDDDNDHFYRGESSSNGANGNIIEALLSLLFGEPEGVSTQELAEGDSGERGKTWKAEDIDDLIVSAEAVALVGPQQARAVSGDLLAFGLDASQALALEEAGFRLVERTELGSLGLVSSRFRLPPGRELGSALTQARSLLPGAIVEANFIYQSAGDAVLEQSAEAAVPEPCEGADCDSRTLVGWHEVGDRCGAGIRIGMTDTAVDPNHPALRGRALRTEVFDSYGDGSTPDHGTAVAGLLVGNAKNGFPGMLPGAELFAADVFHTNDAGESYSTLLSLVHGLDWLVESGVSVVNVSMTGPPNALLEETVRRMDERGVVLVAAAGNGGPAASPAYPAAYSDVVSVTAVDQDLRPYSMANRGAYISFSSPGVRIWSAAAAGSGRHRTGTSFAAAHAAAIIADLIRRDGAHSGIDGTLKTLETSALDLGAPGKDPVFGWGLIQGAPSCRASAPQAG